MLAMVVFGVVAMIIGQFIPLVGGILAAMVAYWWIRSMQIMRWVDQERDLEARIARFRAIPGQEAREQQTLAEKLLEQLRLRAQRRLAGIDWPAALVAGGSLFLPAAGLAACLCFTVGHFVGSVR